jgi:hypothetical protein
VALIIICYLMAVLAFVMMTTPTMDMPSATWSPGWHRCALSWPLLVVAVVVVWVVDRQHERGRSW